MRKVADADLNYEYIDDRIGDWVEDIQYAVEEAGHAEAHDTDVREDLYRFVAEAIDAERERRGLGTDGKPEPATYRKPDTSGSKAWETPPSGTECTVGLYSNDGSCFTRGTMKDGTPYFRYKFIILDGDYAGALCTLIFKAIRADGVLAIYEALTGTRVSDDESVDFSPVARALHDRDLRVLVGPETVTDPATGEKVKTGYVTVERVLGLADGNKVVV